MVIEEYIRILIREIIDEATSLMGNTKTLKAIDIDTRCPKKEYQEFSCMNDAERKVFLNDIEVANPGFSAEFLRDYEESVRDGKDKQCGYCYVQGARDTWKNVSGFSLAKPEYGDSDYNGEIFGLQRKTIDKLNAMGGVRLFSHSDYKPRNHDKVKKILDDCEKVGLKVKAITKRIQFINDFIDHPAVNLVHVSVDTVNSGIDHKTALELKNKYPGKIRIRAVITNVKDLLDPIMSYVDIFTFYHGKSKVLDNNEYTNFSDVDRFNVNKGSYNPEKKISLTPEIRERIINRMKEMSVGKKTCCVDEGGGKAHCTKCKLKCGEGECSV